MRPRQAAIPNGGGRRSPICTSQNHSCRIEHDAARLLAQGDALWATRRAAEAASSGAVEQRIDAALGAGSAGVAGGRGAGMLLLVGIQQGHAVAFNMLDRLYK